MINKENHVVVSLEIQQEKKNRQGSDA